MTTVTRPHPAERPRVSAHVSFLPRARMRFILALLSCVALAAPLIGGHRTAFSQDPNQGDYIELPADESQRNERFKISQIMRAGEFADDAEQQRVRSYYWDYRFPIWTHEDQLANLPALRKQLRNDLRTAQTGPPHEYLNQLAMDFMSKMAGADRVRPAARVNAALMIGELNQVEVVRPGDLPTPLPAALPVLLKMLQDAEQLSAVRAAALVGIRYHAEYGQLSENARNAVAEAALEVVRTKAPPPGDSVEGHMWMRARAAEVLGQLGTSGSDGEVVKVLTEAIANSENDSLLRCAAADALGRLNYAGGDNIDVAAAVAAVRGLAADVIQAELQAYQEDPETFSRRRAKAGLVCARTALTGDPDDPQVGGLAAAPAQQAARQLLQEVSGPVTQAAEVFDQSRVDDSTIVETLQDALAKLNTDETGS